MDSKQLKRIPVSKVFRQPKEYFKSMNEPVEVIFHGQPVAVVVPYGQYLEMQNLIIRAERAVDDANTRLELIEQSEDSL